MSVRSWCSLCAFGVVVLFSGCGSGGGSADGEPSGGEPAARATAPPAPDDGNGGGSSIADGQSDTEEFPTSGPVGTKLMLADGRSMQVHSYTQPFPYPNDPEDLFDDINAPEAGTEWVIVDVEACAPAGAKSGFGDDPFTLLRLSLIMPDNRTISEGYPAWERNTIGSGIGGVPAGQCRRGPAGFEVPVGVKASQVQFSSFSGAEAINLSWVP